jgi:hypothetical protein
VGHVLGLPIPANGRTHVGLHGLTAEQVTAMVEAALAAGLPVKPDSHEGVQWFKVKTPSNELTIFAPDNYYVNAEFDRVIEKKLAGLKFIELPADSDPERERELAEDSFVPTERELRLAQGNPESGPLSLVDGGR